MASKEDEASCAAATCRSTCMVLRYQDGDTVAHLERDYRMGIKTAPAYSVTTVASCAAETLQFSGFNPPPAPAAVSSNANERTVVSTTSVANARCSAGR
ncbi:unnamed protein product [Phytophthora lilii]|uniref:Unnamed protein product n=1 Tax=Phytophthora lilii TaxID=2077276 RepID=A0A9W6U210_9STRA|nr:unnamed protein product [Phytophthora lilii]